MPKKSKPFIPAKKASSANEVERENVAEKAKNRDKDRRPENHSKINKGSRRRAG